MPDRADLAMRLGTLVAETDANPWNLPLAESPDRLGTRAQDVERSLPGVLGAASSRLGFRHIPFSTVAFRDFSGVLFEARAGGCVVGVGFNPVRIGWGDGEHRHVARTEPGAGREQVTLFDDCRGAVGGESIQWADLEAATLEIDDGFWVVGPHDSLALSLALPFPSWPPQ
jgi:hypothetical protein